MAWTAEDRRKYAPAIQEVLRQGMLVRLAATVDMFQRHHRQQSALLCRAQ
jgi:hypothetical protein